MELCCRHSVEGEVVRNAGSEEQLALQQPSTQMLDALCGTSGPKEADDSVTALAEAMWALVSTGACSATWQTAPGTSGWMLQAQSEVAHRFLWELGCSRQTRHRVSFMSRSGVFVCHATFPSSSAGSKTRRLRGLAQQ